MTKYVSKRGACRVNNYHEDPDCTGLKAESVEATAQELEYHDLDPCSRCVTGLTPNKPTSYQYKYQRVTIDEDNDPLDRIHE
jgi:hypothetical protein